MRQLFILLTCLMLLACGDNTTPSAAVSAHPVYDRINSTNTIRCGYAQWMPLFYIDAKSNEKAGIFYDVMQEVGKRLNLKIEWTEELGWATAPQSIKNHRVDMACSAFWMNTARARYVDFSIPISFSPVHLWTSAKNPMQPKTIAELNSPEYTYGYIDGSAESKMMATRLPKAKTYSLPELASGSELLTSLAGRKFDLVALGEGDVSEFNKHNGNALRRVFPQAPAITQFENTMLLPVGETKLKAMVDASIRELIYDGTLENILRKYDDKGGQFYKVPKLPFVPD